MSDRPTVLFVDDEERIVTLLRLLFRNDCDVLVATGGQAALELLRQQRVHVIVCDQRMPGMTGIEVLSKARELSPATMRILLTGYSDLAAIVGSVNEGEVYRFVNKPWSNDELRATVAEAAEIARQSFAAAQSARPATLQAGSGAAETGGALLVVDDNPRLPSWFQEHFAAYRVVGAASVAAAMDALERNDIAVIVTGETVAGESTLPLLRALKQQYPMIMTVMLTSTQDSDLVVRLINEIKVCRVIFRPIKAGAVDLALRAAMKLHAANRADPALWRRERVVERAVEPDDPGLRLSLFERMRARFGWLTRLAGAT